MVESSKSKLGKYELVLPPVGEGSEGLLYKARCSEEGVPGVRRGELVALKRLRHIGRELRPDRFQRQAELLRRLNHPNIVSYKDTFVWRDEESEDGAEVYCLVTEWLEGQSLKSLIEQNRGGVPWELAEGILRQVLQALAYASTERVVHRDLKPSNIYLVHEADEIKVKLIDFGIARPMDAEATTTSTTVSFEGTWHWMAPDFVRLQEDSFRGDERSDIYSFGVCFYQVLTGKFPYGATSENPQFAYFQRWLAPNPPKMVLHPNLNALKGARSCIQKCLEVDRDRRYQTFEELLEAFSKIKYRQLRHAPEVYEYRRYLGQGGFGQVFRGCRLSDGHDVAIKELVAGQHARRFIREAKILQKAPHEHLVKYLDFVEVQASHPGDEPRYFLVLEYLEGMPGASLRERIKQAESGLEPREALILFQGYLDCLEHLHQHPDRIIHRDIKPGNLYAPPRAPEKGKLFDLGIAHDEDGTRTHGQVPGTLDYMPPEFGNSDSGRGSAQSDIYSLAVTLYEALTRTLPLPRLPPGEKAWVEYIARSLQPVEPSFEHRVFVEHPELVALLRCALAHDPKQRFTSAKSMRDEIQKILEAWNQTAAAYDSAMAEAKQALQKDDLEQVERRARAALEIRPHDRPAEEMLAKAQARRLELYHVAIHSAEVAWEKREDAEAERQAELALNFQPGDAAAEQLLAQVRQHKQEVYESAIRSAQTAFTSADFAEAQRQAQTALTLRPNDAAAAALLDQAGASQKKAQESARAKAASIPIQISLEMPPGGRLPLWDELATASTAHSAAVLPPEQQPLSGRQNTTRNSASTWTGAVQRQNRPPANSGRRHLPVTLGALAGAALLAWAGWQWRPYLHHPSVGKGGGSSGASAHDADFADPKSLHNRAAELAAKPVIAADPVLAGALQRVLATNTATAHDASGLETALSQWWTNDSALSATVTSLPLAGSVQKHARREFFTYPGLVRALQSLEESCAARQSATTNLTQAAREWSELSQRLASAPEAALWREYSPVSNLVQQLVLRDFEGQITEALSDTEDAWTVAQYLSAFQAAKAQTLGKLSAQFYKPPEKLHLLRQVKEDQRTAAPLRDYADAALIAEVAAVEAIARRQSPDSFAPWKKRLQESYTPPSIAQLQELPSPFEFQSVEGNLNDAAAKLKGAPGEPPKARLEALKTQLNRLRQRVDTLRQAAQEGLVSHARFLQESGAVSAEMHTIQSAISSPAAALSLRSSEAGQ